ncbi:hypothetical protein V5O48_010830 [Marasmius crinis-equi]|uniref:C2H2-type domain-containing protein n=1 Tax=Marasmius crinis-equi TaxID=585013 RepID=A0ABR3F7B7_9AGAR
MVDAYEDYLKFSWKQCGFDLRGFIGHYSMSDIVDLPGPAMIKEPLYACGLPSYEGSEYGGDFLGNYRASPGCGANPSLRTTAEDRRTSPYHPSCTPEKPVTEFHPCPWGQPCDEIKDSILFPSLSGVPLDEGILSPIPSCWAAARSEPQPAIADSAMFFEAVALTEDSHKDQPQSQSISKTPKQIQACRQVGSTAGTRASLKHRKKVAAYFCGVVGCESMGFTEKHNYDYHMRSHKGLKPYQCARCLRGFGSRYDLNRHIKKSKKPCKPAVA